jgi:hypothetical protein
LTLTDYQFKTKQSSLLHEELKEEDEEEKVPYSNLKRNTSVKPKLVQEEPNEVCECCG